MKSVFMFCVLLFVVTNAHGQVLTRYGGVSIDWTAGVIQGVGVGRSSFDSSIARPSRSPHFLLAKSDAEKRLAASIAALWSISPTYRRPDRSPQKLAAELLALNAPKTTLLSDGTVHARFKVPLNAVALGTVYGAVRPSLPIVLFVPVNYRPRLGLIWCYGNETRLIPPQRIKHLQSMAMLPTFGDRVLRIKASWEAAFDCLGLSASPDATDAWNSVDAHPDIYLLPVLDLQTN